MTEYRLLRRTNGAGGLVEASCGRGAQDRPVFAKRLPGVPSSAGPALVESQRALRAPKLVPVIDVGLDGDDGAWLITEGLEGESLRWVMTSLGNAKSFIKPHEGLAIIQRVAEVMEPLHDRSVVHGDLCASTIFIGTGGEVSLLDAGIAAALGTQGDLGPYRSEMGALAPEQLSGPATPATDVFRLGQVLYELSIGRPLFSGPSPAHVCHLVGGWLGLPRDKVKHVPEPWLSLLVTMLSVDPRTRPSMEEVSAVLKQSVATNGWRTGDAEVAELFARASPGRPPYFDASPGSPLRLTSLMGAPQRPLTPSGTPQVTTARAMTPQPGAVLARVATRKMTREALEAVRLEDAEARPPETVDARVGRTLAERNVVTAAQLQQAKEAAARFGTSLQQALARVGIDEDAIVEAVAEVTNTPAVTAKRLGEVEPGPDALSLLPAALSRRIDAVPLGLKGGTQLLVAMLDPLSDAALAELKESLPGRSVVAFRAGAKALAQARRRLYGELPAPGDAFEGAGADTASELATRTIEALFRLQGARGFHAQTLVNVATALAGALDVSQRGLDTVRLVAQSLATAGLARNRNPWDVPRRLELQELIGFGTDAEPFAEALHEFPAKLPGDAATQAVVVAFAFAAQAGEPKPAGSRLGGALNAFKQRAQLPPELLEALMKALQ